MVKSSEKKPNPGGTGTEWDRLPPHDDRAERAVLGSMILDSACIPLVRSVVNRDSFYSAVEQITFDVLCAMYDRRTSIDAVTLRGELQARQLLEEVGGRAFIGELLGAVPSSAHVEHYAKIVRQAYLKRSLIAVGNDLVRSGYLPSDEDPAQGAEKAVAEIARTFSQGAEKVQSIGQVLGVVREQMSNGGMPTVTTGFVDLDHCTGGIGIGETWLLGGRPSMGKSTVLRQVAIRVARSGVPVGIISLEEGAGKIARNILSGESMIENHRLRKPKYLSEHDWNAIDAGIAALHDAPLYMVEGVRRMADIRNQAALLKSRYGVQLVILDYLQRIESPGHNVYEKVGNSSQGVSDMAKDLGLAMLVAVQLNRAVEHRDNKRPEMADLRDNGQIEQDADGILFIHREDYYHIGDAEYQPTREGEIIVAKMRDGCRGDIVKVRSNLAYQTFEDMPNDPFGEAA